ncbi:monovalent cation/H+ antiporter complex subunit F [Actinopolymorpha pittospori]|jgi:multicomponent Na+:H+ antiporter subunit F|uniref:Multicomponent Na+:H+ antiporter subunit F n=1 Tax=Actinopolymorpha pittospori TaxID=648752 RepID=A0A927N0W0_9ACTN|nr:monovalent cation/H+ antiporter complex subunit F [Actinopolymorpha pittospori]MBE1606670.1 multicomponent Na+:H+ antiporter subunit F [Actinopolymorpha pittospori]
MTEIFFVAAIAEVVVGIPLLARLGRGPTIGDRIVAVNTLATQATLAVLFTAAATQRPIYLDVALWLASFSYLGTIVWARYLERGLL